MILPILILSISLTFANADIEGMDINEPVFDICDQEDTEEGLTLESTCKANELPLDPNAAIAFIKAKVTMISLKNVWKQKLPDFDLD